MVRRGGGDGAGRRAGGERLWPLRSPDRQCRAR
ncbi:hypothetical protein FHS63_003675 [Azospirillum doebereinerae]